MEDWIETTLGEILKLKNGYAFKSKEYSEKGIPIIRISDIKHGLIKSDHAARIYEDIEFDKHTVSEGDILIAMSGATTGKFGIYYSNEKAYQNQRVGNFRLFSKEHIVKKFLYYLLFSLKYRIEEDAYGGAQPNISSTKIEALSFKLPPLPIQRAIVSKLESLLTNLDQGIASLEKAAAQLKIYRQAVLKKAFEGELTKAWRAQQTDLPTAEELLAQIKEERLKHYEQQLQDWEQAVTDWEAEGKVDRKPSKPRKLKELPHTNKEELGILPKGWKWIIPDDVCSPEKYALGIGPFGSNLKVSDYTTKGVPLIFVKNITKNDFKLKLKYTSQEKYEELIAHSVQPLDILITKMGAPPGDCEIYPTSRPNGIITSDVVKFRVWDKFVERKFFKYCIDSHLIKKQLGVITQGVAQRKISLGRFKTLIFPLTSKIEQTRIVQEIESRLSVCDYLVETIATSLKKSKALRQSILKKAFEGRLLTAAELTACRAAPDYEPAAVLLERIKMEKAEREALAKVEKKNKKSKKGQLTLKLKA